MIEEYIIVGWLKQLVRNVRDKNDYVRRVENLMYIEVLLKVMKWGDILPIELEIFNVQLDRIERRIKKWEEEHEES